MTTLIIILLSILLPLALVIGAKGKAHKLALAVLLFLALSIRIWGVWVDIGLVGDLSAFRTWANLLQNGLGSFYTATTPDGVDIFTDYPPGYMYILYVVGFLRNFFGVVDGSFQDRLLLQMPSIVADILTVFLFYYVAFKAWAHEKSWKIPFGVGLLYALNPATWIDCALWGQVDAIHTLILLVAVYLCTQKKHLLSFLCFCVALLVKPQSLMFTPIFLFSVFLYFKEEKVTKKSVCTFLSWAVVCVAFLFVGMLPFALSPDGFQLLPVLSQYVTTMGSYPFVTVNGYNVYAALGLNYAPITQTMVSFLDYGTFGTLWLVCLTCITFWMLHRNHERGYVFFAGSFLCIGTFMLSTQVHERYGFPMMAFLLMAYLLTKERWMKIAYLAFSAAFSFHYIDVLLYPIEGYPEGRIRYSARLIGLILTLIYVLYLSRAALQLSPRFQQLYKKIVHSPAKGFFRWNALDTLSILLLTALYGVVALYPFYRLEAMMSDPYGIIFGILIVPCVYLLAKVLFQRYSAVMVTTIALSFDFLFFTQMYVAPQYSRYLLGSVAVMLVLVALYRRYGLSLEGRKQSLALAFLCVLVGLGAIALHLWGYLPLAEAGQQGSAWLTWPLNGYPVVYTLPSDTMTMQAVVSVLANPAVVWGGLLALVYALWHFCREKGRGEGQWVVPVLLTLFLLQWLPWARTSTASLQCYAPCVLALALFLGYFTEHRPAHCPQWVAWGIPALILLLFGLFYPVISGYPVSTAYVDDYLHWLPTWQFYINY